MQTGEIFELAALAREVCDTQRLIDLLDESAEFYSGVSSSEITVIRSEILASFLLTGLPENAISFALEELDNSHHPFLIAASARALRGQKNPNPRCIPFLFKAIRSLKHGDDGIYFHRNSCDAIKHYSTAISEILETLRWYGFPATAFTGELEDLIRLKVIPLSQKNIQNLNHTSKSINNTHGENSGTCCDTRHDLLQKGISFFGTKNVDTQKIQLQDQEGEIISYKEFFSGKPSVAAFYYTRCENPEKCSLTITRLSELQNLLKEKGMSDSVKFAAISYDANYDTPSRMKSYCSSRGYVFDQDHRSFSVVSGFNDLKGYLGLGVNFVYHIVNKHKLELYLIDKKGRAQWAFTRLQWDEKDLVDKISQIVNPKSNLHSVISLAFRQLSSSLLLILIALFPKCPLCLAAYASVFGISGITAMKIKLWLFPILAIFIGINLWVLWKGRRRPNGLLPFYMSAIGALIIGLSVCFQNKPGSIIGMILIISGSIINSLSFSLIQQKSLEISVE